MKNAIESQLAGRGDNAANQWDVVAYDWSPYAGDLSETLVGLPDNILRRELDLVADEARRNAINIGRQIGHDLAQRPEQYERVHLVAHSAGSWLIEAIAAQLNAEHPDIEIHTTFLDAYTPRGVGAQQIDAGHPEIGLLGSNSSFAEHYIDNRPLFTEDAEKDATNFNLNAAYNVDVTHFDRRGAPADGWPILRDVLHRHGWPWVWYLDSINGSGLAEASVFGFNQSLEAASGNSLFSLRELFSDESLTKGDRLSLPYIPSSSFSEGAVLKIDGVPAILRDKVFSPYSEGNTSTGGGSVNSGSPGFIVDLFDVGTPFNIISFEYEFLSAPGAEGWFSVFLDDDLIFETDERYTLAGTNHVDIPLVDLMGAGEYLLTYRLDPFTEVQSSVQVSGVSFYRSTLVQSGEIDPGPNTQVIPTPAAFGAGGVVLLLMAVRRRRPVSLNVN